MALVIENDEAVRLAMATLLEGWGVGVLDVPGRDEALELLEDIGIAPDVILADFHLEGCANGIDAIAAVREPARADPGLPGHRRPQPGARRASARPPASRS